MSTVVDGIRVERSGRVGVVTFSKPDVLNAADVPMIRRFIGAIEELDADDAVRVIVVTGEGKAFSAGADLTSGEKIFKVMGRRSELGSFREITGVAALRLLECRKPVIAAVNGAAVGFGASLTCAMDIRLAGERARFGFVFARRGMVPEGASGWFLPRIVGIGKALEWACTGRLVTADEAYRAGLVNAVYPDDELLDAALAMAGEIADNTAPVSIAITRQLMWRGLTELHPMHTHKVDSMATYARARSGDAAEGVRAFLDKRQPDFPDTLATDLPAFFPWWDTPAFPEGVPGDDSSAP